MEESNLMKDLEEEIDKEIEKLREDSNDQVSVYQVMELGKLSGLQEVQNWIWSLKEFGCISDEKIREKRESESDTEVKHDFVDFYKNNKEAIETVKKHGEQIPRTFAVAIEKVAKEYMEKQKENTELGWKEESKKLESSDTDKKYCPNCGEEIIPDANYCIGCGKRLE